MPTIEVICVQLSKDQRLALQSVAEQGDPKGSEALAGEVGKALKEAHALPNANRKANGAIGSLALGGLASVGAVEEYALRGNLQKWRWRITGVGRQLLAELDHEGNPRSAAA